MRHGAAGTCLVRAAQDWDDDALRGDENGRKEDTRDPGEEFI